MVVVVVIDCFGWLLGCSFGGMIFFFGVVLYKL